MYIFVNEKRALHLDVFKEISMYTVTCDFNIFIFLLINIMSLMKPIDTYGIAHEYLGVCLYSPNVISRSSRLRIRIRASVIRLCHTLYILSLF